MWFNEGEEKNPKNMWWNDVLKPAVERKEIAYMKDE